MPMDWWVSCPKHEKQGRPKEQVKPKGPKLFLIISFIFRHREWLRNAPGIYKKVDGMRLRDKEYIEKGLCSIVFPSYDWFLHSFSECGAPLYERNGLIRSREFPSRLTYGDCLWDIHPKNKSVLIHFGHLNLPESDGCRYDEIVIVF